MERSDWKSAQSKIFSLLSVSSPKLNPIQWWQQFPTALRLITKTRFLASVGAGGVIYLTPLVFNQENLSATEIGTGLALAALIGTIARLVSGLLLDKGLNCSSLLRFTAVIGILGDLTLFNAYNYSSFLQGELLIGIATGIYWPSIELAVPISCGNFPSSRGFALGRSADALGISIGATIGSIAAWVGAIRFIYLFDIFCMFFLIFLLTKKSFKNKVNKNEINSYEKTYDINETTLWLKSLSPILLISLLTTGILSLQQSALPIDLVNGGINRPPLSEGWTSGLIAIQLFLLVLLQWPIGKWVSNKSLKYGFRTSIICLGSGCLLIGISSLWSLGAILIVTAQLPIAFGLAAFLPTATEAIIQEAPINRQGFSMALFSQCFAISAFISPIISGKILDQQGNGLILWTSVFILCIVSLIPLSNKKYLPIK